MEKTTEFVKQNSGILSTVAFLAVCIGLLYLAYTYLYPEDDPTYTKFMEGEADARKPVHLKRGRVPAIYTGGDFTLSFWIYIDDWNYRVSASKLLFSISPTTMTNTSRSPLVGVLTPLKNSLLVRANTVSGGSAVPAPGAAASSSSAAPDITVESNLQALLNQQTSMAMFENPVDTPCDVKEVPLQRWVNVTVVSSGRVLDVYMDGKLSRSCVLDNVVHVPRGRLQLRLGEFGGRYSSIQMWTQQLTPDAIYGIYQMGPTQAKHDIFTTVAKWLNINVTFTGSAPGEAIPTAAANDMHRARSEAASIYDSGDKDVRHLISRL
jgi:hypothetical protein